MKKGFTLLEILLVIAAIGILAAIVIVAINPNRQLAQVRDAKRRSELRAVYQAVQQYAIENSELPPAIQSISDNTNEELCAQNATDCTDLIDLRSDLVPKYLAEIPSDPLYFTPDETGYLIGYHNGSLYVVQETREDEDSEYIAVGGLPENFEATRGRFTWTPAEITTALWLDADDASTITLNGSNVSQWDDKSGNNRHATEASNSPVLTLNALNGKSAITFDGSNDLLTIQSSFLATTSLLIICVVKENNGGYGGIITSKAGSGSDGSPALNISSRQSYEFDPGDVQEVLYSTTTGIAWHLIAGQIISSASSLIAVDGTSEATSSRFINFSGTASTTVLGKYRVGDSNFGAFDLAEIIVLTSGSTLDARQKLEGYLAHKWGLTANLPVGHPYKNQPPLK